MYNRIIEQDVILFSLTFQLYLITIHKIKYQIHNRTLIAREIYVCLKLYYIEASLTIINPNYN